MSCEVITSEDGSLTGILCCRGGKTLRCARCNKRKACRLCDWKLKGSKTCDQPLCATCSVTPVLADGTKVKDKDLCPAHAKAWEERKARSGLAPVVADHGHDEEVHQPEG